MSRTTIFAIALLVGAASVGQAQKGKGGHPTPNPVPTVTPSMPTASSNASVEAQQAVKKHDARVSTTERATPAVPATRAVPGKRGTRTTPAVRATPAIPPSKVREAKGEEKTANREFSETRREPEMLVKHIKLTAAQRHQVNAIRKSIDGQLKTLEKQERADDKAGTSDAAVLTQLANLRAQEQAEIRAVLTPAQQAQFDANLTAKTHKK